MLGQTCGERAAAHGFTSLARRLVQRHQPDMAWADPLLNYIGDDISEQRVIADFCCNRLNAIAIETGAVWCLLHHTGKPSKDPKATEHWTASDLAYSGLGSSALVNWSRETAVLLRVKTPDGQPPTFQLSMTKRSKRAGQSAATAARIGSARKWRFFRGIQHCCKNAASAAATIHKLPAPCCKNSLPGPPFGGSGDFCSTGSGAPGKEARRG